MICKFKVTTILGGKLRMRNRELTVEDEWYDHWFFQKMLTAGLVEVIEPPAASSESTTESTTKKSTKKAT
jgi:hypothetical protein